MVPPDAGAAGALPPPPPPHAASNKAAAEPTSQDAHVFSLMMFPPCRVFPALTA
ncbi:exported hypothetical protein [Cupriavidus taiwanensis]|uniref:Uncharacterized protein n=1 Tax=Cupriavidus taiwanensis TaxID=164546 RepID=A0A375EBJ0_9BURK|nr:exported hypothetical protein [Cupriavidus taiwanensis]SPA09528.1 exported hypothetical protein [Cupriavidus taiwanensis]